MMNWIYNWYDPKGTLSVAELVDSITKLFLTGFLSSAGDARFTVSSATSTENLSVWRASK